MGTQSIRAERRVARIQLQVSFEGIPAWGTVSSCDLLSSTYCHRHGKAMLLQAYCTDFLLLKAITYSLKNKQWFTENGIKYVADFWKLITINYFSNIAHFCSFFHSLIPITKIWMHSEVSDYWQTFRQWQALYCSRTDLICCVPAVKPHSMKWKKLVLESDCHIQSKLRHCFAGEHYENCSENTDQLINVAMTF